MCIETHSLQTLIFTECFIYCVILRCYSLTTRCMDVQSVQQHLIRAKCSCRDNKTCYICEVSNLVTNRTLVVSVRQQMLQRHCFRSCLTAALAKNYSCLTAESQFLLSQKCHRGSQTLCRYVLSQSVCRERKAGRCLK